MLHICVVAAQESRAPHAAPPPSGLLGPPQPGALPPSRQGAPAVTFSGVAPSQPSSCTHSAQQEPFHKRIGGGSTLAGLASWLRQAETGG